MCLASTSMLVGGKRLLLCQQGQGPAGHKCGGGLISRLVRCIESRLSGRTCGFFFLSARGILPILLAAFSLIFLNLNGNLP